MRRMRRIIASFIAAFILAAGPLMASAQQPAPAQQATPTSTSTTTTPDLAAPTPPPAYVAAPPPRGNPQPTADLLIDSLNAVERAQVTNPAAATTAAATYARAMSRYEAHDSAGARGAAAQAISEANVPAFAAAGAALPAAAILPRPAAAAFTWTDTQTMDAESFLGLAQDAFSRCTASGATLASAQQSLASAQANLAAHKPDAARDAALATINGCAGP